MSSQSIFGSAVSDSGSSHSRKRISTPLFPQPSFKKRHIDKTQILSEAKREDVDRLVQNAQNELFDSTQYLLLAQKARDDAQRALEAAKQTLASAQQTLDGAMDRKNRAIRSTEEMNNIKKARDAIQNRTRCSSTIADLELQLDEQKRHFRVYDALVETKVEKVKDYDLNSLFGVKDSADAR